MRYTLILMVCSSLAWPASDPQERTWSRFRGHAAAGISLVPIPTRWDKANTLWQTPIEGQGHGSPIVWENKLFLPTSSSDGSRRLLIRLNATTGKVEWSQTLPGNTAPRHRKNSLASSTPTTDGQMVYLCTWDGRDIAVVAYDFAGQLQWQTPLGSITANHGAGHSPIVYDGLVYVAKDHDSGADLIALDAKSGKIRWQKQRPAFRACYSTPLINEQPGQPAELIVVSTADVAGYDPQTGEKKWFCRWSFNKEELRTVASPFIWKDLVIVSSGSGGGERQVMAVRLGGLGDVTTTHRVWQLNKGIPYVPTMVAHDDWLFYVNDQGIAGCLEARSGKTVWTQRLSGAFSASPLCIAGNIYACNEDGDVFVFAAAASYKLLAKNSLNDGVIATPAAVGGRLYLRTFQHLWCIGSVK